MKLLVPEHPVVVLPSLAAEIGLNEAIVLQQIHYWAGRKEPGEDGVVWIYKTHEEWTAELKWLSASTVKRVIRALRERGLVATKQPDGIDRRTYLRVLYENVPDGVNLILSSGQIDPMTSTKAETTSEKTPTPSKRKVNKKVVTDDEFALAAAVVGFFNSSAGTALSVDAHLTPIVSRIRERPDYGEAQHRAIIEAVFAGDHWWNGAPTPKIIYGNAGIFEQSIELARAAQASKQREEDPNAERERVKREFEEADDADQG